ncbi:hypothetical protein MKZ38_003380 [Zalerion maritima]|uniref:Hemerythrin-like domain-containing protein n=1 Tax=Zalerion maritima TaxID=339359 RepID=A0AAD5WQ97_9PEZI|nr:hypothetical protein MKZ38_003380 [Zalerion maritima]
MADEPLDSTSMKADEEAPAAGTGGADSTAAVDAGSGKGKAVEEEICEDAKKADSVSGETEEEDEEKEEQLPPLSAHEFKQYNRLAEHMDYFHNHFRQTWTRLYTAASNNKRPPGTSLRQFLDEGLQLISHLTAHHNIEETYLFPVLAKKMPEFRSNLPPDSPYLKAPVTSSMKNSKGEGSKKRQAVLIQQHRLIHEGMDVFEAYLRSVKSGETDFEMSALKEKMNSWGDVLWEHLDLEVKTLGAENMRRYWSLDEIRRIPM